MNEERAWNQNADMKSETFIFSAHWESHAWYTLDDNNANEIANLHVWQWTLAHFDYHDAAVNNAQLALLFDMKNGDKSSASLNYASTCTF